MSEPTRRLAIELFPQEILDLHTEVRKHPELLQKLYDQDNKDVYIQLLEIATHLNIYVEGTFTRDDILALCKMLTAKLYERRSIIVMPY